MKYFKKFVLLGIFALCGVSFCNSVQISCDNFSFVDIDNILSSSGSIDIVGTDDCYREFTIDNDDFLYLFKVNYITNPEDGESVIQLGQVFANDSTNYSYGILSSYRDIVFDFYSENSAVYTLSWNKIPGSDFSDLFDNGYPTPTVCPTCTVCPTGGNTILDSATIIGSGTTVSSYDNYVNIYNINGDYGTYCVNFSEISLNNSSSATLNIGFGSSSTGTPSNLYRLYQNQTGQWVCLYGNKNYLNIKASNGYAGNQSYKIFKLNSLLNLSVPTPSCPSCPDQYSSLQCQTEYNLIPISDVTKNYCEVNFDLIDPLDCPSSPSGSGDVSRSALYIDNVQYSGAPNIYININDLLEYSMTYVSGSAVIDVNGYSYDTGYMADILTIQEYHPTSEDFTTSFVSFLTFALPYVVVILFVVFVRKLIRKIFKF